MLGYLCAFVLGVSATLLVGMTTVIYLEYRRDRKSARWLHEQAVRDSLRVLPTIAGKDVRAILPTAKQLKRWKSERN